MPRRRKRAPDEAGVPPESVPEEWEAAPEPGWVAPALAEEFPDLGIAATVVASGTGRSSAALRERLRELSDRFHGSHAVALRQRPIPWAYRVFFRHIGLDPDETRTPVEEIALERMRAGGFKSHGVLADAITIATVESGVALTAFDADVVEGRLGLRLSARGEGFAGRQSPLPEGTIVIADEKRPLAILFRTMAEGVEVKRGTERTALVAIRVRGVPDVSLEEALWLAASAMRA